MARLWSTPVKVILLLLLGAVVGIGLFAGYIAVLMFAHATSSGLQYPDRVAWECTDWDSIPEFQWDDPRSLWKLCGTIDEPTYEACVTGFHGEEIERLKIAAQVDWQIPRDPRGSGVPNESCMSGRYTDLWRTINEALAIGVITPSELFQLAKESRHEGIKIMAYHVLLLEDFQKALPPYLESLATPDDYLHPDALWSILEAGEATFNAHSQQIEAVLHRSGAIHSQSTQGEEISFSHGGAKHEFIKRYMQRTGRFSWIVFGLGAPNEFSMAERISEAGWAVTTWSEGCSSAGGSEKQRTDEACTVLQTPLFIRPLLYMRKILPIAY